VAKTKTATANTNVNPAINRKVRITLVPAAQEMFNHQPFGDAVSFDATVASTASAMKDGRLVVPADRIQVSDDVCNVTLTVDDLRVVFQAAREYRASRPVTIEDAKTAVEVAERAIDFAASNNSGIGLSTQEKDLADTKTKLRKMVFGTPTESAIREIVDQAYEVARATKQAVVDFLKTKASALAAETACEEEFEQVLADMPTDLDAARKSLVDFIKKARTLRPSRATKPAATNHGASHPLRERIGTSLGRIGR